MSTLGKQKYIFSPSSFGASIAQRDAKFVSLAGEVDGEWDDPAIYLAGKPSWALQSALETFTLNSGSTDPMLASMGLYWSVSGSGNTKTVEYVNNIVTGSGMTSKHYSGLTAGHLSMISHVYAGTPSDATGDLVGWKKQQLRMPIDTDAVHNFCDAIEPGVIVPADMLARNAKFIVDFYNKCRLSDLGHGGGTEDDPFTVVDTFLSLPLSDLEITALNTDITTDYATIDSEYNFWSQRYERVLSGSHPASGDTVGNSRPDEKILPNCALQLCAEEMEESNDTRRQIKEINTYYTHEYDSTLGMLTTSAILDKATPAASSAGSTNFWNSGYPIRLNHVLNQKRETEAGGSVSGTWAGHVSWAQVENYQNRLKNIIIDKDHIAAVGDPGNKRENYPFYVDLQFKTDTSTTISDALAECNLMDEFMIWLMAKTFDGPIATGPFNEEYYEATSKWDFELTDNAASIEMTGDRMTVFKTNRATLQMNDFTEWLVDDGTSIDKTDLDGISYFTTSPDETGLAGCDKMKNKLYAMIFQGKLKEVADKWGHNTITNCWDSKPSYSDTVAYRIAKYDEAGTTLIQNIYLPNTSDIDLMRYIDTQVRYNDKYTYRIYAYQAMNVTDYIYDSIDLYLDVLHGSTVEHSYIEESAAAGFSAEDYALRWSLASQDSDVALAAWGPSIKTDVYFKNRIQIVEIPIYAQKVKILDSAPLSPEVSLIPLKDSQHNIHIMLNNRTGREFLETVNIMGDSDADLHTDQAAAQRLLPGDKFLFESEERPDNFQIFRTEVHPTDWSDFQPYLHMEVQPSLTPAVKSIRGADVAPYGTNLYAHAVSVWDHISVNTKYYYTFRTVDVHGFISNPTEIYCVELVNNDGATYLLVEAVDFAPKVPKQKSINFTRYLKVAPRITQVMLDNEKYDSGWDAIESHGGMQLGVQDQAVWGKKFRFTIRSQKTGREIHMYADFKKTHNTTNREIDYTSD